MTGAAPRAEYPQAIPVDAQPELLPLPDFNSTEDGERFSFGARSEAAEFVGTLLLDEVPSLSSGDGELEIMAIARRPGVLSKVAIRPRGPIAPLIVGIGADPLARVSRQLGGERIQVVRWQRSASAYIADALGLGEVPPVLLLPGIGHARVLLGEIDVRGIAGWRDVNVILASALTGWRIRLEPVAATPNWARLQAALQSRRPVTGHVLGHTPRGTRVEVLGLYAVLSGGDKAALRDDQEIEVRVTRMDPDEGRIFVSDRLSERTQLPLL